MKEKKQSDLAVLLGYAGSHKGLTFRLFTDKENAQNHCNVGNGKIVLDAICNWIQSIDAEAMER